jgi:O-succinylbenzoate synthase
MRGAEVFAWKIPLEAGVVLRDRRLKTRSGLLVRLSCGPRQGWGEIAPLPGFSQETVADAQRETVTWLASWCAGRQPVESLLPSVAFGLSCALAELSATLPAEGSYCSAILCTGDPDELVLRLQQQYNPLAKIKVGLYEPVRDGVMVNLLLEALPTLTLRLDANRSWTLEKALNFARFVAVDLRPRIAFLEEPCRSPEDSLRFSVETGIALGWDESSRETGFRPVAEAGVRAIIIKPTLTGSLTRVRQLIAQAHEAGLQAVISSSLESSLGLSQLARIAHWLTPEVTPGLDTLEMMQHQLVRGWPDCTLPLLAPDHLECLWRQ